MIKSTGSSGFIGMHLAQEPSMMDIVFMVLYMNEYYDVRLKKERLKVLSKYDNFTFDKIDLAIFMILKIISKSLNLVR